MEEHLLLITQNGHRVFSRIKMLRVNMSMESRIQELQESLSARVLQSRDYPPNTVQYIFSSGVYDNSGSPEIVEYIKNNPGDRRVVIDFTKKFLR